MKSKLNAIKIFEWIATILSIVGAILNAFLIKTGFYLWFFANLFWMWFAIKEKHWGMFLTFLVYEIITIIGIIYWASNL